jgi:hypothetical protein
MRHRGTAEHGSSTDLTNFKFKLLCGIGPMIGAAFRALGAEVRRVVDSLVEGSRDSRPIIPGLLSGLTTVDHTHTHAKRLNPPFEGPLSPPLTSLCV